MTDIALSATSRTFPFEWDDPAEAAAYWRTDLVHNAYPQVPLVTALRTVSVGMAKAGPPPPPGAPRPRQKLINGYLYTEVLPGPRLPPPLGIPEGIGVTAYWEEYVLPEVTATTAPLKAVRLDAMTVPDLVAHALGVAEMGIQLGILHRRLLYLAREATAAFEEFCREAGIADEERDDLLHGVETLSLRSTRQLWQLGRMMAADPRLAALAEACRAEELDERVRAVGEPAAGLLAGVEAHITEFGWRPAAVHPFSLPVTEDRTPVWDAVRAAALYEGGDPLARHAALAARREGAAARVRARLAPEQREPFERLYAEALPFVRIFEDHNVHIDQVLAAFVQRACARLSERMVADGLVGDAHDTYFLTRQELKAVGTGEAPPDLRATLAGRRAEWETWCTYTPPVTLGTRTEDGDAWEDVFLGRDSEERGVRACSPASPPRAV